MDARGLTYRGLAQAIGEIDDKGLTHAPINMLANGHAKPSRRAPATRGHATPGAGATSAGRSAQRRRGPDVPPHSSGARSAIDSVKVHVWPPMSMALYCRSP
jgi:hypothetical protein